MKKKIPVSLAILFVTLCAGSLYAQNFPNEISGVVYDKSTGESLQGVNVFLSGTVWGASTDKNGYFEIKSVPPGNQELVISIIGYKVELRQLHVERTSQFNMIFNLESTSIPLDSVQVSGKKPEEWFKQLAKFKELFLGTSRFAKECVIENEYLIDFTESENGQFTAKSPVPLVIINKALGFRIDCVLVDFALDLTHSNWVYSIKPKFTELPVNDKRYANSNLKRNREIAYFGSLHHFLVTFKHDSFSKKGFKVYLKEDLKSSTEEKLSTSEDIYIKGRYSDSDTLRFKGYLKVEYNNLYTRNDETSYLNLVDNELILDQYAYPEESKSYTTLGHWAHLGVADMLPRYYYFQ